MSAKYNRCNRLNNLSALCSHRSSEPPWRPFFPRALHCALIARWASACQRRPTVACNWRLRFWKNLSYWLQIV